VPQSLVSVTRVLNEDDIIKAFVRHNAHALAHRVVLDSGSSDDMQKYTIGWVKALAAE
jgi:hypothetical protein